jgi:MoaA/NifB/PqqE/SkfB family radical SAM enzyme
MCIGPDRSVQNELTTKEWKNAIRFFADRGTNSIVFTGGEPLMREDIGELLEFAKSCGLRVTLSTNALLLADYIEEVVAYVDDVGIPIDGSTEEINSLLRPGNGQQLEAATTAIRLLREKKPDIEITIRTVVTQANIEDLSKIGLLLKELPKIDRWKLYELVPTYGIVFTTGVYNWDTLKVDPNVSEATITTLRSMFPDLSIEYQTLAAQISGYVHVWPNSNVYSIWASGLLGNFRESSPETLEARLRQLPIHR